MTAAEELGATLERPLAGRRDATGIRVRCLRAAFSFPSMLSVSFCLLMLLTVRGRFDDPDMWWHLKVGEIIWNSHSIPRTDQFSYTTNQHSWLPHEWLSQLAMYAAYRAGGYTGLWCCLFGLAALLVVSVYWLCSLYSGNSKLSMLGGLVAWFFGTVGLAVRPLIFGHLLLVVEVLILHLARSRGRAWLWALPPLFAVWVNCHGSYALGIIVLGIAVICSFISLRAGRLFSIRREPQERRALCIVFLMCLAALMINPVGPKLLSYPLNTFTQQAEGLAQVSEWQPTDIANPRGAGFFALAGAFALIFLLRTAQLELEGLLLLLVGFAMALQHVRLLFAFGILAAPILCRLLADVWDHYDPEHDNRAANALLITAAIVVMICAFPHRSNLEQQVRDHSPAAAVEFLRQTAISGPMLNEYEWGGYLIWALPEQKVFIDGRGDVFDWTGVFSEYGRWATLQEDPEILLNKYRIHFCLLRAASPMARVLPYLPGWQNVYTDSQAVVFARK
jgi:hypothetical protein